jgi:hypothetical protein
MALDFSIFDSSVAEGARGSACSLVSEDESLVASFLGSPTRASFGMEIVVAPPFVPFPGVSLSDSSLSVSSGSFDFENRALIPLSTFEGEVNRERGALSALLVGDSDGGVESLVRSLIVPIVLFNFITKMIVNDNDELVGKNWNINSSLLR